MILQTVTIRRTSLLGDGVREDATITAGLEEGDNAWSVLEGLRQFFSEDTEEEVISEALPATGYTLLNYLGEPIATYDLASEWLYQFDCGASKTADIQRWVRNNTDIFTKIKEMARTNPNPRAYEQVQQVESRIGELCKNA